MQEIALEMTGEAVTEGRVQGVLGWLCDLVVNYRRLGGKTGAILENELSNRLGPGNFVIGQWQ